MMPLGPMSDFKIARATATKTKENIEKMTQGIISAFTDHVNSEPRHHDNPKARLEPNRAEYLEHKVKLTEVISDIDLESKYNKQSTKK
jgi:hypothetical protein